MLIANARERLFAVLGAIDAETLVDQRRRHRLAQRAFVLDDQRPGAGWNGGRRWRRHRFGDTHRGAADRQLEEERRAALVRRPSRVNRPPCSCAIAYATVNPRPVPFPTAFVVKNGSKTFACSSSGTPGPSSLTSRTTASRSGSCQVRSISVPRPCAASIACSALMMRFSRICWI